MDKSGADHVSTSVLFSKWEKTTVCLFVGVAVVFVDLICSFAVQRLECVEVRVKCHRQ